MGCDVQFVNELQFMMFSYCVALSSACVVLTLAGADSGFGHALAKHLDKLGFRVFAGVLDAKGSGAEELRKTCSERLLVLQMDVTKLEQIKDAHSKVTEKTKDKGTTDFLYSSSPHSPMPISCHHL